MWTFKIFAALFAFYLGGAIGQVTFPDDTTGKKAPDSHRSALKTTLAASEADETDPEDPASETTTKITTTNQTTSTKALTTTMTPAAAATATTIKSSQAPLSNTTFAATTPAIGNATTTTTKTKPSQAPAVNTTIPVTTPAISNATTKSTNSTSHTTTFQTTIAPANSTSRASTTFPTTIVPANSTSRASNSTATPTTIRANLTVTTTVFVTPTAASIASQNSTATTIKPSVGTPQTGPTTSMNQVTTTPMATTVNATQQSTLNNKISTTTAPTTTTTTTTVKPMTTTAPATTTANKAVTTSAKATTVKNNIDTRDPLMEYNMCMCIPSGSCSSIGGNVSNDGVGQLDIRIVNPARSPAVIHGTNQSITSPQETGTKLIPESQTECSSEVLEMCCPEKGYQCGMVFPPVAGSRALGGRARFGEFPWQGIVFTTSYNYVGSGVLIDHLHFLTVAHRMKRFPRGSFRVRFGDWDTSVKTEPLPHLEFAVADVFYHPDYNASNMQNSIAVLRLEERVPLGQLPTVATACLSKNPIQGLRCFVAGWGRNDFAFGSNQPTMRKVDLMMLDSGECQKTLRMTRLGRSFKLHPGFMCAGGEEGKDACTGDGGAPLVCQVGPQWYAVGLVAWGINCASTIPGVYMNVNYYMDWIKSVTTSG